METFKLFTLTLQCLFIDLQAEFRCWYDLVICYCETCRPSNEINVYPGTNRFCRCKEIPYHDKSTNWSLQNAILCISDSYLDKTMTRSHWHAMIDPTYSSLSIEKLDRMIRYAIYDVLALSYLHWPITGVWSHDKIRSTSMLILLSEQNSSFSEIIDVYEDISEEDDGSNQSLLSFIIESPLLMNDNDMGIVYDRNVHHRYELKCSRKLYRSKEARQFRNRRRNHRRHRIRYRHHVVRQCYRRFTTYRIRMILKQSHVDFTHIKIDNENVIIGIKSQAACDYYEGRILMDIFDRDHFFSISRSC